MIERRKVAKPRVVVEPIVSLNDELRRLVWTVQDGMPGLTHYHAAAQVYPREIGGSRVVWSADLLPNEAAAPIGAMMQQGAAAMTRALARLAQSEVGSSRQIES
jgi:Polyketide cyclase / dehydrase and lipid transport